MKWESDDTVPTHQCLLVGPPATRPEFREAQWHVAQHTPHTAMVTTADVGNPKDVHPTHKRPVGERLALAARATVYGEAIESSGPAFQALKITGSAAHLTFSHTGGGLIAKGGPLTGFAIAGADRKFVPATAEIRGDEVVVSSKDVPTPFAVRYGWENVPVCNLFNQAGLPALPFRSDR